MNRRDKARLMSRGGDPRLYDAWANMLTRYRNPNYEHYRHYGDRGITVCRRWLKFENFAADMGPHPGPGWSLDRKNNDGNYCKSNCRWATYQTQMRNRSITKLDMKKVEDIRALHATGGHNQKAIAARFGVSQPHISGIIRNERWPT